MGQYSTEECSTVQLLASSLKYPERIRVDSVVETFVLCSLLVIKFSHFSLFHPSLFLQYSTEECSTVQLFIFKIIAVMVDIDTSSEWIGMYVLCLSDCSVLA